MHAMTVKMNKAERQDRDFGVSCPLAPDYTLRLTYVMPYFLLYIGWPARIGLSLALGIDAWSMGV